MDTTDSKEACETLRGLGFHPYLIENDTVILPGREAKRIARMIELLRERQAKEARGDHA